MKWSLSSVCLESMTLRLSFLISSAPAVTLFYNSFDLASTCFWISVISTNCWNSWGYFSLTCLYMSSAHRLPISINLMCGIFSAITNKKLHQQTILANQEVDNQTMNSL